MGAFSLNKVLAMILLMVHFLYFIFSFVNFNFDVKFFSIQLMELIGLDVSLYFIIDFYSLMFSMTVCLITSVVIGYSIFYMGKMNSNRFVYLVFFFFLSMLILINSGNFFLLMLGWDGLGVVSFALVIFYQNEISIKSGLITIFMNRFGDGCMILFMCIFFLFNSEIFLISDFSVKMFNLGVVLFFLACFSKSAQFPFMSWLPAAMTAPTPVSSLVHSSTLVTAGVYLLIRFNVFMMNLDFCYVTLISLFTMGVGGFLAMIETDFKSVIAFSTLSQLGLLVFIVSFGETKMCFFHLLSHAIFKSFLFMMCGIFMASSFGNQDGRIMGVKLMGSNVFFIMILFSCLNLGGFPLTMGFLSKDLILETFLQGGMSLFYLLLFILFCCFTVCYSMKLFFSIIFFMKMGFSQKNSEYLNGGKLILLMLFFFMVLWGLVLEEFMIEDEIFSLSQDYKFIDLLIWGVGIFFFFENFWFLKFGNMTLDYFWMSTALNYIGKLSYSVSLLLNFSMGYSVNFLLVDMYSSSLNKNYKLDLYLNDKKNFWNFIILLGIFFIVFY